MKLHELREIVTDEVRRSLREDYARGIPDFALSQVASSATDDLRRHLKRHIQQTAQDPVRQRQMLQAANVVLEELEDKLKQVMEDKLLQFVRAT